MKCSNSWWCWRLNLGVMWSSLLTLWLWDVWHTHVTLLLTFSIITTRLCFETSERALFITKYSRWGGGGVVNMHVKSFSDWVSQSYELANYLTRGSVELLTNIEPGNDLFDTKNWDVVLTGYWLNAHEVSSHPIKNWLCNYENSQLITKKL